jgi:uncharacterized membrane-anchored protein
MINAMISSVLQPGVVLLTALGVYALARRPGRSFMAFVGLTAEIPYIVALRASVETSLSEALRGAIAQLIAGHPGVAE